MSSVIPRNCDDVIVNFCVRTQTVVKLQEFKEHVEESQSVVLSDEQAKTLFHAWLKMVHSGVDGQQVFVDVELDNDDAMDSCMDHLWDDVVNDNIEIPDDWQVARCQTHTTGCNKISVGTYGDDKTPLCEEHKVLANYDDEGNLQSVDDFDAPNIYPYKKCSVCSERSSCGNYNEDKQWICEGCGPVGCEHPSPEVKEVAIVSDEPPLTDFFQDKATPVKESTFYDKTTENQAEILALKDRVMRLEMAMIRINSKVVFEVAKTTEALLSSGPAFPVTMVSKKDILLAFEKLQSTLASVLVNPI